jgi:hypothetical protein
MAKANKKKETKKKPAVKNIIKSITEPPPRAITPPRKK